MYEDGSILKMESYLLLNLITKKKHSNIISPTKYIACRGIQSTKYYIVDKKMEGFLCGISKQIYKKYLTRANKSKMAKRKPI